jgi:L-arabinose isomerase
MSKIKIGFLPLWLKLYDDCCPEMRPKIEAFTALICAEYEKRGIEVIIVPICRLKAEFSEAVKSFEEAQVDAILTLHLAYSPSLESAEVLAQTDLPIVILDTTQDFEFGFDQNAEAIMYNHGIHGVQDMCNLLLRNDKNFMIEAGHWQESDVIDRTLVHLKACQMTSAMHKARVGIIGKPFAGMGDFAIDFDVLKKTIGIEVTSINAEKFKGFMADISDEMIDAEIKSNLENFTSGKYSEQAMRYTAATSLAVRVWLDCENLNAFTVNFLNVTKASGIPVVPFLEASQAMTRGKGYAGEGDVLTAALVGALMTGFPETTFTEMFCPDWKGNKIFLSHMGEINTDLCAGKTVLQEKPFPYTDADNPVVATGCLKPGAAYLINIAPGPNETYTLIVAPVEVCDTKGKEAITDAIRGWVEPSLPISDFLAAYSKLGGTHHLAISYNANENILKDFATNMNWNFELIN